MTNRETSSVVLAGGCFWGVEELFLQLPGVISTRVGYAGGHTDSPTYETVKTGTTGHAECIEVTYQPDIIALEKLLQFFFSIHDPTTINQQGNDKGSQYRSVIFYNNDAEKAVAEKVIAEVSAAGHWLKPIVTEVVAMTQFFDAEDYHQKYLQKNPGGYTCHFQRYQV